MDVLCVGIRLHAHYIVSLPYFYPQYDKVMKCDVGWSWLTALVTSCWRFGRVTLCNTLPPKSARKLPAYLLPSPSGLTGARVWSRDCTKQISRGDTVSHRTSADISLASSYPRSIYGCSLMLSWMWSVAQFLSVVYILSEWNVWINHFPQQGVIFK